MLEQGPASFYGPKTIDTEPSLNLARNAKPVLDNILKEQSGVLIPRQDSEHVLECQEAPDIQSEMHLIFASFSKG